jgi:hypothetical protein
MIEDPRLIEAWDELKSRIGVTKALEWKYNWIKEEDRFDDDALLEHITKYLELLDQEDEKQLQDELRRGI